MINNVIAHLATYFVCYLSKTYPGRRHDKGICNEEEYFFPDLAELFQDTGFQGFEPDGTLIFQPKKKPRNGELSVDELFINKVISSVRIRVEHIIAGIKRCRIVKDKYRNHLPDFDDTAMEIACGLHNLRVRHRQQAEPFDLLELAL